jgi:hypothetical protein
MHGLRVTAISFALVAVTVGCTASQPAAAPRPSAPRHPTCAALAGDTSPLVAVTPRRSYVVQLGGRFWAYSPGMKTSAHFVSEDRSILALLGTRLQPAGYAAEFQARATGVSAVDVDQGEGGVRMRVIVTC